MDAGSTNDGVGRPGNGAGAAAPGLGVGSWTWEPAEGRLHWSDGVRALLRIQPDSAPAWEIWLQQVHPDDRDMVRQSLLRPGCNGAAGPAFEYRLIRGDGSMIWIEDRRQADDAGTCHGVFIDVTHRARAMPGSLDARNCTQRVIEEARIGVHFLDFEAGEDYWNDALYRICGLERSAAPPVCDQLLPCVHPEDAERIRREVDRCRASGDPFDAEYRILTPSGEQRWLREHGCYLTSGGGALLRYYGAVQDVTGEKRRMAELEDSRRLLRLALELNGMGVWEWNRTTDRQAWSDEFFRLLGYEPGEVEPGQEPWRTVLHPDDRDWAVELFEGGNRSDIDAFTYRIMVGGNLRWIRESWKDFIDDHGASIRVGVTADVTDWKEREHRYAVTDRWLRLAVDGGGIGLWSHDDGAQSYQWNDFMFSLLGYGPGEIEPSAEAWYARIHPADRERVRAALDDRSNDGREVVIEYRVIHPGNVERWLEERGSARAGNTSVHHGVLFDITEQKALQQRIETDRQKLQLALDTGKMGFWSGHEAAEEWDARTYRLLGYEPFSVVASSQTFLQVVHPQDRPEVLAMEESAGQSGEIVVQEYRIVKPDGAVRWIESRRMHVAGGTPDRYGVVMDITDRKSREEFHLRSQRLETAGQLLRGLAHDFNNFLAVISATLESIGEMAHEPEAARRLLEAKQAAVAGALFSRRLINISKHREWRPQVLSVGDHVSRLVGIMKPLMKSGIMLSVQYPADLWPVNVDPLECDSAVINLLVNARDAISSEGSVTISVSNRRLEAGATKETAKAGEYVVLAVRDTGRGMDESTLTLATEPFFTTKPEGAGTGLGLSSVAAFTAAAGGFISIESVAGEGTSVSLHLPRAAGARIATAAALEDFPLGQGELVLVVDDEGPVREITMQRLEALGYAVEEASDAASAVNTLRSSGSFDLVLSDINMPGTMNGFALRERLASEMPSIPVLLITGHVQMAGGTGRKRIISKLCSQGELARALAAALATRKEGAGFQAGSEETGTAST